MSEAADIMESPLSPWLEIFKQLGVAGLFISMYLTTIYYFFKEMKDQKKEMGAIIEKQSTVLERSTRAVEASIDASQEMRDGLQSVKTQTSEFMAYLRGRDEGRGGR